MSAQENKDLARRFMEEVWNKGNLDFVDEVTAPNFLSHDPASPQDMGGAWRVRGTSSRCTATPSPTPR